MSSTLSTPTAGRTGGSTERPASLDTVLGYAWDADDFTATDVMAATGLTRTTAIEATQTLVELGLLRELPNAREAGQYQKGRPARRFEFRAEAGLVVGVDAGHSHLTATVANLRGVPLTTISAESGLKPGTEHNLDGVAEAERRNAIVSVIDNALSDAKPDDADVFAICLGVPAPVDESGVSPVHRTGFWQRINPDLVGLLKQWAPVVRVENDASLAALAEAACGAAQGCRNFVTMLAGSRLGSGVVVDGNLLRGARGGVGEMGAFEHVEGVSDTYGLGYQAAELARRSLATDDIGADSELRSFTPEDLDGRAVIELAAKGDPDALRLISVVGQRLARIVSVFGGMYDPEKVIVAGGIGPGAGPLIEAAQAALPSDLYSPAPEIVASQLGDKAVVTGAVVAAVDLARTHALDLCLRARE
ncbi:ROK family protein [Actinomycetaceae bacterium MB13-C1-2]|nr:ROK family protein [Actinomycetaceae bacterium MB13-C1-2]